ncbi:MAG: hypothetical protein NTW13_04930, partial [Candidatus Omnitrophica bacterium]|nr:hypothetical protein [Candidatus Omnitrophota bacterium]
KLDKISVSLRDYENKISSLNRDLERASGENAELKQKYELLNKAKEELVEKLKSRQAQVMASPQEEVPQTNDAYWASILKAKTDLELQLSSIGNELKSIQINNEQLQREKGVIELDLNSLKRENGDLKRQLDYNKKLMDSIAQELVREKNDKTQIQDSYRMIKNENAVLNRQLKSLNSRKTTLERKLQDIQEDRASLERRVSEMETILTDKISQIGDIKDKIGSAKTDSGFKEEKKDAVELPAIVVKPQVNKSADMDETGASLKGRVLAVNRDNNFVIIDLGEDSGVKIGDSFKIYRSDKPIASVEAIQVRRDISACDIKKEGTPVKIGDIVR